MAEMTGSKTHAIVFLDREAFEVDFRSPSFAHDWVEYPHTSDAEIISRSGNATMRSPMG